MSLIISLALTLGRDNQPQLLIWDKKDVNLLRDKYRIICPPVGCLPSNPLQNLELSLPTLLSLEQLLVLLSLENLNDFSQINLTSPQFQLLLPGMNKNKDWNQTASLKISSQFPNLINAPLGLFKTLNQLVNSHRYLTYQHLYLSSHQLYITSGSKFGGDFLLYYDDPSKCHSQHIVNVIHPDTPILGRHLISLGRLATGVSKTRVFAGNQLSADAFKPQPLIFTLEWSGIV